MQRDLADEATGRAKATGPTGGMIMSTPNEEFIAVWNEILVPKFKRFREVFVLGAAPHSARALAKHPPLAGQRVLDVGCGFGETTLELARLVAPGGAAVGFDCCEEFLAIARDDARDANLGNASFVLGDAQTHTFDGSFDLLFARFGTMFFQAPKAALRNLRKALRPGGQLMNITWRPLATNAWTAIPKAVALKHLPPPPEDGRSCGPGPFSMADPEVVRAILEGAGYVDVAFEAVESPMVVGRDVDEAIEFQLQLGPAGEIVREAGELGVAKRAELVAELRAALEPFVEPRGVVMDSSSWVITATNPG
jgi:ubiquinone/menaquinone biosynthesis C-methylase UbiE